MAKRQAYSTTATTTGRVQAVWLTRCVQCVLTATQIVQQGKDQCSKASETIWFLLCFSFLNFFVV